MSENEWTAERPPALTPRQRLSTSPTEMSFPASRPTSPSSLLPFHFGTRHDTAAPSWSLTLDDSRNSESFSERRRRRSSAQSRYGDKAKDLPMGKDFVEGSISPTSTSSGFDSHSHTRYNSSSPVTSLDNARPSTADSAGLKRSRGSILVAASDVLGFRFGKRRQSIRQPPMPIILPDVIEISAARRDEEVEERNRLREMAAQSIGLPLVHRDTHPAEQDAEEIAPSTAPTDQADPTASKSGDSMSHTQSQDGSTLSVALTSPAIKTRLRSGSVAHSRTSSTVGNFIPPFPAACSTLIQYKQSATVLHKFYPPSSLRIFALSRNWRSRFMMLCTPTSLPKGSAPSASYLHLFKSESGDEKEMERLEINENSVVFLAEEDVGGRKHVVKVGGVDVGALKKELSYEEGGRTMWLLHVPDVNEAQKWITEIKNVILGQRTVRAGLGLPSYPVGGVEPRGDMDVMLSMRAQGLITSPVRSGPLQIQSSSQVQAPSQGDQQYAPSVSSHRSQATVPKPSSGPVSTLKGFFTRPRSGSRATSINSEAIHEPVETSLTRKGNPLLGGIPSATDLSRSATPPLALSSPLSSPIMPSDHPLERKIVAGPSSPRTSSEFHTNGVGDIVPRTITPVSLSLQPPPRKRWTSVGPSHSSKDAGISTNGYRSRSGSVGANDAAEQSSISDFLPGSFSFGSPEQKPRAPSIQSVSTLASAENSVGVDRSSSSTKHSSMKRWSRQSALPPKSSPAGPSTSASNQSSSNSNGRLYAHPYALERSSSHASTHSAGSQKSVVSSLPSFSKRASGSSAFSVNTLSTTQSHPAPRPPSTFVNHRFSMPPPRPAPTSALPPAPDQGATSEPTPSPPTRESLAHRTFRLSLIAPKPPPTSSLPPRPDEQDYKTHRRNSSAGSYTRRTLDSIPASPVPPPLTVSPFPPPAGPLPPTPSSTLSASSPSLPTSTPPRRSLRRASIKRRLRILSAPSTSSLPQSTSSTERPRNALPEPPRTAPIVLPPSQPPATPLAEKIIDYHDEASFLQINTPIIPSLPLPRPLPHPPDQILPEVTSLSPAPRRNSKQIVVESPPSTSELEAADDSSNTKLSVEDGKQRLAVSRPGSVISLGIVSM